MPRSSSAVPEAVTSAFERIADWIMARTACDRVVALQRAADEHPGAYERYLEAMAVAGHPDVVEARIEATQKAKIISVGGSI